MKESGKKSNNKEKNWRGKKHVGKIIIIETYDKKSPRRDPEKEPPQIGWYEWIILLLTAIPVLAEYPGYLVFTVCATVIVLKLKKQLDTGSFIDSVILALEMIEFLLQKFLEDFW